jgi:hypothetical protein
MGMEQFVIEEGNSPRGWIAAKGSSENVKLLYRVWAPKQNQQQSQTAVHRDVPCQSVAQLESQPTTQPKGCDVLCDLRELWQSSTPPQFEYIV